MTKRTANYEYAEQKKTKKRFAFQSRSHVEAHKQVTLSAWILPQKTGEQDEVKGEVDNTVDEEVDVGVDEESDSTVDEAFDVGVDEEVDVGVDEEVDVGVDEEVDVGVDEESDSTVDEASDVGVEKASDVGVDEEADEIIDEEVDEEDREVMDFPIESIHDGPDSEQCRREILHTLSEELAHQWAEVEKFINHESSSLIRDESFLEDYHARFEVFRARESALSGGSAAHIVRPSGDPRHALHLKLNYPTFQSHNLEYGESADITNRCTRLLLEKGLSPSDTFWFEACYRRLKPTTNRGPNHLKLPQAVESLHTDFAYANENFPKKAMLILGTPNRKDFLSRHRVDEKLIQISRSEKVPIGIIRDDISGRIQQLVVFCPHPEWLFWNWTIWASRYFDACINVAAALAGVAVCPDYFTRRAQRVKASFSLRIAQSDADTTRKLEKMMGVVCNFDDLPSSITSNLPQIGISEAALRQQQGISLAEMVFQHIKKSLPAQSSWNKGVRMPRNLPRNAPVQPRHDLDGQSMPAPPDASVRLIPNKTRSKNEIVKTAVIHQGRRIPLMCIRCGVVPQRKPIDSEPAFCTISSAKGRYIAQRQACNTAACNPKERKGQVDQFMIPQDPSIPFIRADNLCKVTM